MFALDGKKAFITGGTSGIGLAAARRFARAGANVAIVGRRDAAALARDFDGVSVRADVADEEQLRSALALAEEKLGKLDILVNNAGVENSGPRINDSDAEEFQRVIDINVKAVYNGLRYGPAHMNDGGSIINTASLAGRIGLPGYCQYGATKAAVISMTQNAAMELVPRKIRVNAVCPGSVWSEMLPPDHPEVALTEKFCPMGRIGETEEIAALFHFLAAPDCAYMTGQAIVVDGGISAGFAAHTFESLLS